MSALNNALVIDTDVGFDDIISIQCLHLLDRARPSLITTVGGMNTSQNGADYLRALFPSKQVVAGSNSGPQTIPQWLHKYRRELREFEVELDKLNPAKGTEKFETKHAAGEVEKTLLSVRELLLKSPDKSVDVLCLGPLTNVAYWVQKEGPLLQQKINSIWIMGGNDPDSVSQKPEFNFAQDPFATSTVLQTPYLADTICIVTEAESSRQNFEGKEGGNFLESISCYVESEAPDGIFSQIFRIHPTAIYYDPLSAFAYDSNSSNLRCMDIRNAFARLDIVAFAFSFIRLSAVIIGLRCGSEFAASIVDDDTSTENGHVYGGYGRGFALSL
eukprot:scaffold28063_cov52-Attheya_sp.AAC.5